MENPDYYEILGVSKDADFLQVKAVYREQALKFHPDRNMGNRDAVRKMKQLNEAYAVLSIPEKRKEYDALLKQYGPDRAYKHFRQNYSDQDIFSGTDIHKVFDELARSFGFRNFMDISNELQKNKGQWFEKNTQHGHLKGFFFFGAFSLGKIPSKHLLTGTIGKIASLLLENISGTPSVPSEKDQYDTIQIDPELARTGGPYAYYHKSRQKKLVIKIPQHTCHGQQIRLTGMGSKSPEGNGNLYLRVETMPSLMGKIKQYLPF